MSYIGDWEASASHFRECEKRQNEANLAIARQSYEGVEEINATAFTRRRRANHRRVVVALRRKAALRALRDKIEERKENR